MNDEKMYVAQMIPTEMMQDNGLIDHVVKRMVEKVAIRILVIVSDGKEYAIKMLPEKRMERPEFYSTEIRRGISVKEIVHCKDCIHNRGTQPGMVFCPQIVGSWVEEDFYCADGERRSDGE